MRKIVVRLLAGAIALVLVTVVGIATYALAQYQGWTVRQMEPEALSAMLRPHDRVFRPPGEGPFPTALLFSGCDGPHDNMMRWAEMLNEANWAAIVVDSNAPRGRTAVQDWRPICRGQVLWGPERAGDVVVSLSDARAMPFVDPDRIVLLGSSHGAWSIMELLALGAQERLPFNLANAPADVARHGLEGVVGTILLYPYCGFVNRARRGGWRHPSPSLFLLSGEDALAPAEDCIEIADQLADTGIDVTVRVFDGVTHGFDQAEREPGSRLRFDPEATAEALQTGRDFVASLAPPRRADGLEPMRDQ